MKCKCWTKFDKISQDRTNFCNLEKYPVYILNFLFDCFRFDKGSDIHSQ